METKANTTRDNTTRTKNLRGLGQRFLLRLLAVALIAAACTLAGTVPADAKQRQRPTETVLVQTNQPSRTQNQNPSTQTPSPRPAPARDDRAKLQPDAVEFVAATALPAQAEFAHVFSATTRHLFTATPAYLEPVVVTTGQLKIDRTISYELKPGVCRSLANRQTLGDLCFEVDASADLPAETAAHLATVRSELAKAKPKSEVVPGVTVAQAVQMNDIDLLELSLNSGPRTIRRTSTMPLADDGSLVILDPSDPLVATTLGNATQHFASNAAADGVFAGEHSDLAPFNFDTEYFLTGHTVYRSYGDTWTYEKDAWWHPRIYVSFSYSLDAGFGVRAPFSIDVDYVSGGADETVVAVSVDPVSLDVAAEHVGLPSEAYFDGKEFVFELNFDCELTASVAGIGGSKKCDDIFNIDFDFGRDFDPVIGSETRNIENWFLWEDGESPLRREVANGAIWGEVNLGVGVDLVDGEVGVQIDSASNTDITGVVDGGTTWFGDRSATEITVIRDNKLGGSGFEASNPEYRFDVAVRPKVRFTAGVDTFAYENHWSFTAPLDFLGFSVGFGLDHHDETVESHDYELYEGFILEAELGEEAVTFGS